MKRAKGGKISRAKTPATVRLARSGLHGYGLFARTALARGARIIEYVGERITKAEADRRDEQRLARLAAGGDGCVYIYELNQRHDIDGRVPWNLARRINHACAPNCETQVVRGRIWIVALRDIAAGEELFFDYGLVVDGRYTAKLKAEYACHCGSPNCRGTMLAPKLPAKKASRGRAA